MRHISRGYEWMQEHPAMLSFMLLALIVAVALRGEQTHDEGHALHLLVVEPPQRDTCATFRRVGYACPKPGSRIARREHHSGPGGGDALQTPTHPAHQQPSPPATGGGSGGEAAARPSPSEPSSAPVEVPSPASESVGPVLESVGGLVRELPCVKAAEVASVACN